MPRRKTIRTPFLPYHIVNRVNNREPFQLPMWKMWEIITLECYAITQLFEVQIHTFVLMMNHFHMILTSPKYDIDVVMKYFGENVATRYNKLSGRSGHLFGGRYRWNVIGNSLYFAHATKYVYRNPVKAGLCSKVEEYRFSTINGLLGKAHLPFPIYDLDSASLPGSPVPGELNELMEWLNTPYSRENEESIRKALRRKEFGFSRHRTTLERSPLEQALV